MKGVIHMIDKILEVLENYEKEYREIEREFPCKYYTGRADAFHEIWEIISNMESDGNPYKQYEEIKRAISKAEIPPAQYEQLIQKVSDILGI